MTERHERIEELLAGYALQALDEEEARETEVLLAEHLPGCETCREAFRELQRTAGELALAAPPAPPPDLLLARLHRGMRERRRAPFLRRPIGSWLGTAAAIAVIGLAAWNAALNSRLSEAEDESQQLTAAMAFISRPESQKVSFDTRSPMTGPNLLAAYQEAHVELIGTDIPEPAPGDVYRLWVESGGHYRMVLEFTPEEGFVVLSFFVDLDHPDHLVITEERSGDPGPVPDGRRRWSATIERAG